MQTPQKPAPKSLATVRNYGELMSVLRTRCDELGITREAMDYTAGLQSGYAAKLLSPNPIKAVGPTSLGPLLGVLRLKLIVVEDESIPALPPQRRKRGEARYRF